MNKKIILLLGITLALTFFLRFYRVTEIPPSLNWDEISIAYNAYSILKTGRDEWNQWMPVHFKSYGEYKLPAQVYLSIPGIKLFGLNELGVRITPVIYGTLTVIVTFFLGKALFKNSFVGLLSAFLLAISPWHIQLTRASFESSLATFFVTLGILLYVLGFKDQKWFIISMIPFAFSIFTYNATRIFTPLFLLATSILYRDIFSRSKKFVIFSIILFVVLILPLTPFLISGERSARYKLVSITDEPGLIPRINENRGRSKLPSPFPRLIHNKATYIAFYFTRNYLSHFTPQFLFISGAPHKQHHVQNIGELYLFQAPFLIIGLVVLFYFKHRFKELLLSWLLLAYIPVSATGDSIPHALRTLVAAPFYQMVTAFGAYQVYLWFKKKEFLWQGIFIMLAIFILMVIQLGGYLIEFYKIYPIKYSRDWQYGYRQVVDFVKRGVDNYDLIVFTRHYGEPHMFTLFYLNYDPSKYQNDPNLIRFETYDWVRVLKFDKFYFPDLGDKGTQYEDIVKQNPGKKLLFIGKPGDFPSDLSRLLTVDFLDGNRAFELVESK